MKSLEQLFPEHLQNDDLKVLFSGIDQQVNSIETTLKGSSVGSSLYFAHFKSMLKEIIPEGVLDLVLPIVGVFFSKKGTLQFFNYLYDLMGFSVSFTEVWKDPELADYLGVSDSNRRFRMLYLPYKANFDKDKFNQLISIGLPVNVVPVFGYEVGDPFKLLEVFEIKNTKTIFSALGTFGEVLDIKNDHKNLLRTFVAEDSYSVKNAKTMVSVNSTFTEVITPKKQKKLGADSLEVGASAKISVFTYATARAFGDTMGGYCGSAINPGSRVYQEFSKIATIFTDDFDAYPENVRGVYSD